MVLKQKRLFGSRGIGMALQHYSTLPGCGYRFRVITQALSLYFSQGECSLYEKTSRTKHGNQGKCVWVIARIAMDLASRDTMQR